MTHAQIPWLTVVNENVHAAPRPLVRFDCCSPDAVRRARKIDGDEVGLIHGKLLVLENGEKLVEFGAVLRENCNRSPGLELMRRPSKN